jgi:hypothetical protein
MAKGLCGLTVLVVSAGALLIGAYEMSLWIACGGNLQYQEIDRCLDGGGVWLDAVGRCEGSCSIE